MYQNMLFMFIFAKRRLLLFIHITCKRAGCFLTLCFYAVTGNCGIFYG